MRPRSTIVHVITRLIGGGADENTLLTCNHQAAAGYRVVLIIGRESDPGMRARLHPKVDVATVASLVRSVAPMRDVWALFRLALILRRIDPDVVHTHTSKAGILGRLAARASTRARVVHTVHILPFLSVGRVATWSYTSLERLAARWTDLFIDVSAGMRDASLRAGVGDTENHVVIESGMDIARYQSATPPEDWRDLIDPGAVATRDQPRFVLVAGALEERKRVAELLAAFAQVSRQVPDAVLLVAGDGPERETLAAAVTRLKLEGRVVLLGFREDLDRLIGLAEVCVHAAHREGLPRVVVQYAAAGRPVVACALPGLEAVVESGRSGFLVPADDVAALAEPVSRLLRDHALREAMGRVAGQRDYSGWSVESMVSRIDRAYARVCGEVS